MPRAQNHQEVQILRFFEDAPLQKAEMLFNIVRAKMRARSSANPTLDGDATRRKGRHPANVEVEISPQRAETP